MRELVRELRAVFAIARFQRAESARIEKRLQANSRIAFGESAFAPSWQRWLRDFSISFYDGTRLRLPLIHREKLAEAVGIFEHVVNETRELEYELSRDQPSIVNHPSRRYERSKTIMNVRRSLRIYFPPSIPLCILSSPWKNGGSFDQPAVIIPCEDTRRAIISRHTLSIRINSLGNSRYVLSSSSAEEKGG